VRKLLPVATFSISLSLLGCDRGPADVILDVSQIRDVTSPADSQQPPVLKQGWCLSGSALN
jgi:hypothetical protein